MSMWPRSSRRKEERGEGEEGQGGVCVCVCRYGRRVFPPPTRRLPPPPPPPPPFSHLKDLLRDEPRCDALFHEADGVIVDMSRQRQTAKTNALLLDLARRADLRA